MKSKETSLQSRFKVVDYPPALPGCCFLCNSPENGPFIDTGMDFDFHGAVYFCRSCLVECASAFGFIPSEEADSLQKQVEDLNTKVYTLSKKEGHLEEAIGGLLAARAIDGYSDSVVGGGMEVNLQVDERPSSEGAVVGSGAGAPPESGNDERVGELRSNVSSDEGNTGFIVNL